MPSTDPSGRNLSGDDVLIYSRQLSNGDLAIGFFNLKDESVVANLNLDEVGLPMSTRQNPADEGGLDRGKSAFAQRNGP